MSNPMTFNDLREYLLSNYSGRVIEKVLTLLGQNDGTGITEPERSNRADQPMDPPKFEQSKHYHPAQGVRSKGVEGLIIN